jgi:hypothetical protein
MSSYHAESATITAASLIQGVAAVHVLSILPIQPNNVAAENFKLRFAGVNPTSALKQQAILILSHTRIQETRSTHYSTSY